MGNQKMYYRVTATIFVVIAVAHAARVIWGWEAVINDFAIPMYVSYAAILISGYLAFRGFTAKA